MEYFLNIYLGTTTCIAKKSYFAFTVQLIINKLPFLLMREKSLWSIEDFKCLILSDEISLAAGKMASQIILGGVLPSTGVNVPFQNAP